MGLALKLMNNTNRMVSISDGTIPAHSIPIPIPIPLTVVRFQFRFQHKIVSSIPIPCGFDSDFGI